MVHLILISYIKSNDNFRRFQILPCRNMNYLVTWASNDGWEDSSWGVITSKASFAHTRAIVYDKSGNVFVTHLGLLVF